MNSFNFLKILSEIIFINMIFFISIINSSKISNYIIPIVKYKFKIQNNFSKNNVTINNSDDKTILELENLILLHRDNNNFTNTTTNNSIICDNICDEEGGTCINQTVCQCKEDFTTLPKKENHKLCNYQKKNRISTAFIELFFGFGVGHLYSDRKVNGFLKMILFFIFCCISCCSIALLMKFEEEHPNVENSVVKFFLYIYACVYTVILYWQLFDFFMFIFRLYNDGNDIPFA